MNEATTKRSSLTSRASKIPQKIQSSLFSLKPSTSTNEKLSTRITQMLFRPKSSLNNNSSIVFEEEMTSSSNMNDSSIILLSNNENDDVTTTPYSPKQTTEVVGKSSSSSSYTESHDNDSTFSSSSLTMNVQQYVQSLYQKLLVIDDMNTILSHTRSLIKACIDPTSEQQTNTLYTQLNNIQKSSLEHDDSKLQDNIHEIKCIIERCLTLSKKAPCLCVQEIDGFTKELPKVLLDDEVDHKLLDQLDLDTCTWFRHFFVGKPYHTFIGSLNQSSSSAVLLPLIEPNSSGSKRRIHSFLNTNTTNNTQQEHFGIISVIEERVTESTNQYRIIIRSKKTFLSRYIVHESMVKETISQLESKGESFKLTTTRSIMKQSPCFNTMMQRAAILTVCPTADVRSHKELSAESTILAGLEKDLLKYDEIHVPKHYKFGLLTIKDDQTTEEAWFANTDISDNLKDFLNLMGHQIELKGYTGYSAGLDTKSGESGKYAYVSKWNQFDIAFHVAPLMPIQKNDRQQVLRKKHIGNDIVCIIFLEGDQLFNPKAIRSQFLHVYIIIRPEITNLTRYWRVEILRKDNVNEFGPSLPSPPIFYNNDTLKEFLTLKLMNAENAALKSEKFSIPNRKARIGLLSTHIQTGLSFQLSPSRSRSITTRNKSSASMKHLKIVDEEQQEKLSRPKSIHVHKSSTTSRLLREALLDEEKRKKRNNNTNKETVPPMPYLSKSTMLLHDFKNGIVSSSKKIINAAGGDLSRKTTQLKVNTNNGTKTTISLRQQQQQQQKADKPWRTNSVVKEPTRPAKSPSRPIPSPFAVSPKSSVSTSLTLEQQKTTPRKTTPLNDSSTLKPTTSIKVTSRLPNPSTGSRPSENNKMNHVQAPRASESNKQTVNRKPTVKKKKSSEENKSLSTSNSRTVIKSETVSMDHPATPTNSSTKSSSLNSAIPIKTRSTLKSENSLSRDTSKQKASTSNSSLRKTTSKLTVTPTRSSSIRAATKSRPELQ